MVEMVCAKHALSVKLGVLGLGGLLMVYGNRTTESQSAQRTNDGDDYYSEANMLLLFKCS